MKRYFSHDFDAWSDPKIQQLLADFGVAGYGAYWYIVEQLYRNDGILPLTQCKGLANAMQMQCKDVAKILSDYNLFENDGENFWSDSINARVSRMKRVSEARRASAISRWDTNSSNSKKKATSKCNANAMQMQGKYKYKDNNNELLLLEGENGKSNIDYNEIIDLWTENCPNLSKPTKMTDMRREKIRIRLSEMGKDRASQIATIKEVFAKIGASDFCNGKNDRGWKADFDWILKNESNWVKVIEDKYINKTVGNAGASQSINELWQE
jgi:hypothetical protein